MAYRNSDHVAAQIQMLEQNIRNLDPRQNFGGGEPTEDELAEIEQEQQKLYALMRLQEALRENTNLADRRYDENNWPPKELNHG